MPVTISIRNRNQLERDLQRQISVLNDQTALWQTVIDNVLRPRIRETFASDGFGRWQPRVDNLPHPLLRKSGTLFRSLVQPGAPGNVDIRSEHSLEYGTDIAYADYHEFGTSRIPARPYLQFAVENGLEGKLLREIDMWFDRELNRGGR